MAAASTWITPAGSIPLRLKNVLLSAERNLVQVELRSNELQDAPLQRDGFLKGKTVTVDLRAGTPLTDITPFRNNLGRGISEKLTQAGSISLDSAGDVITKSGARPECLRRHRSVSTRTRSHHDTSGQRRKDLQHCQCAHRHHLCWVCRWLHSRIGKMGNHNDFRYAPTGAAGIYGREVRRNGFCKHASGGASRLAAGVRDCGGIATSKSRFTKGWHARAW